MSRGLAFAVIVVGVKCRWSWDGGKGERHTYIRWSGAAESRTDRAKTDLFDHADGVMEACWRI
jgi:hypothetical protein